MEIKSCPFCGKNNIEIVRLLIEYANQHHIILELNEKFKDGNCPLLWAISKNNMEIVWKYYRTEVVFRLLPRRNHFFSHFCAQIQK